MGLHRRCRAARRHALRATPSRQQHLLELQAIDTRLDQLAHSRSHVPQVAEHRDLETRSSALDDQLVRARTALGDVQREVSKAETDVQLVRQRAARDQERLDAGSGSAKDLQATQHELQSLARRQSELEDVEIEIMERAESLEADVRRLEAERTDLTTRIEEVTVERDRAFAGLDAESETIEAPRAGLVGEVGEDLVALYEKIRQNSGGRGAAALRQRRCGGCQLELNQVEVNRIKAAEDDEVLRCEECRRILVRTPESGV